MLIKAEFKPGFIADDTPLEAEGGFVDGNLIRFRQGKPEVWGGWTKLTASTYTGVARGGKTWANLAGAQRLAFGTQSKLYGYAASTLRDITPNLCEDLLGTDPFSLASGATTVTHPGHGLEVGDSVTFSQSTAAVMNATFTVASVLSSSKYTVSGGGNGGGFRVMATASLPSGNLDQVASPFALPRTWNVDNFGEAVLADPNGRKLFAGVIHDAAPTNFLSHTAGNWARTGSWGSGAGGLGGTPTNYAILKTGAAGALTGNLSQNIQASVTPGRVYRLAFTVAVNSNGPQSGGTVSAQFRVDVNTTGGVINIVPLAEVIPSSGSLPPGSYAGLSTRSYSFTFTMPAGATDIMIFGSVNNDGTHELDLGIDVTSAGTTLTEVEIAPIDNAPIYNEVMFVDPNRMVVMGGTVGADDVYDPMLVRWCDQDNYNSWVPSDTNLAGEEPLSRGGRIMGGVATQQQNLIFTDEAVYSMQFTGNSGDVFSLKLLGTGCGLISRYGAVEFNGVTLWMSNNKNFYIFQGGVPQIIDCPVRSYVFDALNMAQYGKINAGINSANNEVVWFYPRNAATENTDYVCYNWVENHWTYGTLARTTWLRPGVFPNPIAFYPTSNLIYNQESGNQGDGAYLPWSLTTSFFDIQDGDNIAAVRKYIPDFERQSGPFSVSFNWRYWPDGPQFSFGPYAVATTTTEINVRMSGRQGQIVWQNNVGGGDTNLFARWGVQRFDTVQTGARR